MSEKKSIGFIGTGVMGKSMAGHLLEGGHTLFVYNRTKEKTDQLVEKGAIWCETIGELAEKSDVVITIVGYPADVEDVYFKEGGILDRAKKGTIVVDMTTSSPVLAERIGEEAVKKGVFALDAPVSGGDVGAKNAKLSIMVGGEEETFEKMKPIFSLMGTNIRRLGTYGAGQHTKMSNQILIASTMIGVSESLAYAEKSGLDAKEVLAAIETGAAGSFSLSNLGPRMLDGDLEPGFYIKHFMKDISIALKSAEELGLDTPGVKLAKELYEDLVKEGKEDKGTQALYTYYINE